MQGFRGHRSSLLDILRPTKTRIVQIKPKWILRSTQFTDLISSANKLHKLLMTKGEKAPKQLRNRFLNDLNVLKVIDPEEKVFSHVER